MTDFMHRFDHDCYVLLLFVWLFRMLPSINSGTTAQSTAIHVLECLKMSFHTVGIEKVEATQSTERYTYRSPSSWGLAFSDGPVKERKAP